MRTSLGGADFPGHLLWFNLAMDESDPILGFTSSWVRTMAPRVPRIHVVTMRRGQISPLPPQVNLTSLGKETGTPEIIRALRFYATLAQILRRERISVCFSHMTPIFTIMAAPLLKLWKVPVVTWYAHRAVTRRLRWADRLSTRVVSVNGRSYPLVSSKLVQIGHGIDTQFFEPAPNVSRSLHDILVVSRISPIKDPSVLFEVVPKLREGGLPVRCTLVGAPPDRDLEFSRQLERKLVDKGLQDQIRFAGPAVTGQVRDWYRRCGVHVHVAPANNAVDKVPLEAMATGLVSFSSAASLQETLGQYRDLLFFKENDPDDLKQKLETFFRLSDSERENMAAYLRNRVVQMHDLRNLVDRLLDVFRSCTVPGKGEADRPIGQS
ncbi:MAG TPA: glycosyltransferase family 4 protein [Acidobacteriota bacterium]|nr:glycosyltransferase family 4 protein [Acidobacteriota bacterium]